MATTRTFQDMLNEYLPNRLLREELVKRDYVLQRVNKDNGWKGGQIIVPFKGTGASSVKFGSLTAAADIAQDEYVRGTISAYKEVWGSIIFNQTDLQQHDGKIPETTFLKVLPDVINDFMEYMKMTVSFQLMGKSFFAAVTDATNAATGIMIVDRVDRFCLGQKCVIDDDDSVTLAVYVIAINVNTSAVTFSATRGGAAVDISAYSVAQNAVFYFDGVWDGTTLHTFNSVRNVLLSAANGGSANVHGKSKLAYPYLQAVNVDGSSITAALILDKIFDAYTDVKIKAKGTAYEVLMSWKHMGSIRKLIEVQKGGFKVTPTSEKASEYGWEEIEISSVSGQKLKFVGIQEMDDDIIIFMDWRGWTFRSNGFFKKRTAPDGKQYYEIRNTTGYEYILDTCLFGELEGRKPGQCGIIHSVSY